MVSPVPADSLPDSDASTWNELPARNAPPSMLVCGIAATAFGWIGGGADGSVVPPSVTCVVGPSSPVSRASTASTTWLATVRPKRASHALATAASSSLMVPVAAASPPLGIVWDTTNRNDSSPSTRVSSVMGIETVTLVSSGWIAIILPSSGCSKSLPAVAEPFIVS